jgi:hypothetical protein
MDENRWNVCDDPSPMLAFLRETGRASDRKMRLFAVACLRRVHSFFTDARSQRAVEVLERFADGRAYADEMRSAAVAAGAADQDAAVAADDIDDPFTAEAYALVAASNAAHAANLAIVNAEAAAEFAANAAPASDPRADGTEDGNLFITLRAAERAAQAALLRDLFGSGPGRPLPSIAPGVLTWNNGAVGRLAWAAYEERHLPSGLLDPARLAVLADALEEAGLSDAELLGHLRGPGPHVRGCFALDATLEKA